MELFKAFGPDLAHDTKDGGVREPFYGKKVDPVEVPIRKLVHVLDVRCVFVGSLMGFFPGPEFFAIGAPIDVGFDGPFDLLVAVLYLPLAEPVVLQFLP